MSDQAEEHEQLEAVYRSLRPDDAIELTDEVVKLAVREEWLRGRGRLSLSFLPYPRILCQIELEEHRLLLLLEDVSELFLVESEVRVPARGAAFCGGCVSGGKAKLTVVPSAALTLGESSAPEISRLIFHLLNFYDFSGSPRVLHKTNDGSEALGRVCLCAEGWSVVIHLMPNARGIMTSLKEARGHAITHVGSIARGDGSLFTGHQACEMLEVLQYFLSFARGLWSPAVLPVGYDRAGNVIWRQWAMPLSDPWRSVLSWFDPRHSDLLEAVFPGFIAKWTDAIWKQPLRHAIYWYLTSNTMRSVDGAVVLLQAALEALSWTYAVQERKLVTPQGFGKLWASDRLRVLLSSLGIPLGLPDDLPNLQKEAAAASWLDGPHAFTEMRNSVVHPSAKEHEGAREMLPETWQLGLWYVELVLLRLFGHCGKYHNRLKKGWVGEVEEVPWMNPEQDSAGDPFNRQHEDQPSTWGPGTQQS